MTHLSVTSIRGCARAPSSGDIMQFEYRPSCTDFACHACTSLYRLGTTDAMAQAEQRVPYSLAVLKTSLSQLVFRHVNYVRRQCVLSRSLPFFSYSSSSKIPIEVNRLQHVIHGSFPPIIMANVIKRVRRAADTGKSSRL